MAGVLATWNFIQALEAGILNMATRLLQSSVTKNESFARLARLFEDERASFLMNGRATAANRFVAWFLHPKLQE